MNSQKKIQHLNWRAGFGMNPQEWEVQKNFTSEKVIDQLFQKAHRSSQKSLLSKRGEASPNSDTIEMDASKKNKNAELRKQNKMKIAVQNTDWILRMGNTEESAFLEKMCLFWHGHFACVIKNSVLSEQYLNTIRKNALGNFRELLLAISQDASIIRFLNNQQNKKRKPNENFARELMELFTIGRGNYSEQDVKEAARSFTGWSSNSSGEFIFKKKHHDFGEKIFMGKTGNWNGEDVIEMLLEQKETACFIARKAYRFFVNEKVDEKNLRYLTEIFYASNYDIEKLMRTIFESEWFYEAQNVGNKIKSPVELLAGIIRTFNVKFKKPTALIFVEKALGQVLFNPPNVAGWAGGKSWIDNSTLMFRLNLASVLFQNSNLNLKVKEELEAQKKNQSKRKIQASIDLNPMYDLFKKENGNVLLQKIGDFLLAAPTKMNTATFKNFVKKDSQENLIKTTCLRIMTLPEYQLC